MVVEDVWRDTLGRDKHSSRGLIITYKNEFRGVEAAPFGFFVNFSSFSPPFFPFKSSFTRSKCDTLSWWTGTLVLRIMESDISVYFSRACISAAPIPKSLKHSYLTMCARPALHVWIWCVLPPICVLELVNQPVVFRWRTSTQSLTCPQRRLSLSLSLSYLRFSF